MSVLSLGAEPVTCQADLLLIRRRLLRNGSRWSSVGALWWTQDCFCSGPSLSVAACCKHQGFTRALTWTASPILHPCPAHLWPPTPKLRCTRRPAGGAPAAISALLASASVKKHLWKRTRHEKPCLPAKFSAYLLKLYTTFIFMAVPTVGVELLLLYSFLLCFLAEAAEWI